MKKIVSLIITYLRIFFDAFFQHVQEVVFFVRAKSFYLSGRDIEYNPALCLRKRVHHLERYMFAPDRYKKDTGEKAAKDIKYILEHKSNILSSELLSWAIKILREYEAGSVVGGCMCPSILNGVKCLNNSVDKNSLIGLMARRRSRRVFEQVQLTKEEKESICNVAQLAPSACNRQPLYLLFVEDLELKKYVAETISGGKQFFAEAPAIIILTAEAGDYPYPSCRYLPFIDGGLAVQNIYLVCETMGLGCCLGSYTSFGVVNKEKEIRERLKIPSTHIILAALAVGKSTQCVCPIPRDYAGKRFFLNKYGDR